MIIDKLFTRIETKEWLKLFSLIFILKIAYLFFVLGFSLKTNYTLNNISGDGVDYLSSSLNLINNGVYKSAYNDGVTEFVYRMPGMASILTPLLFLLPFSWAVKCFILFQVTLLSIASTYLFIYLKNKCKYKIINSLLFLFLSIGSYLNQYCYTILSETLAISLFIIICCYLLSKKEFVINSKFFLICLFFTWLFFLRPFMIVFLPLICIKIADFKSLKKGPVFFTKTNKPVILLMFIITFFTGLWTLRNYIKTKEFVFLEYSIRMDKIADTYECTPKLRNYIVAFGGNFYTSPYDSKISHMLWFYPDDMLKNCKYERPPNTIFPSVVFSDKMTIDSLESIRATVDSILKAPKESIKRKIFNERLDAQLKNAEEVISKNTNILFKIKSKKDEAISFLYQPTQDIVIANGGVHNILLYLNAFLNALFITFIIIVSILSFMNPINFKTYYYIYMPAFFLILLYVAYFTNKEQRGLFCYYPAFLLVGMNATNLLQSKSRTVFFLKIIGVACFILFFGIYGVHLAK